MKTQLAWFNLIHGGVRTAVAASGVAFAAILIFMQLGFLGAVETTATLIYDSLDFDVAIRSPSYLHFSHSRAFPSQRLQQAASVQGVQSVEPFYIENSIWRNPNTGYVRTILLMGFRPGHSVFLKQEITRKSARLTRVGDLLIDRKTRPGFGSRQSHFGDADLGTTTEIAAKRVTIVGHFELGTGLAADGAVILSDRGFARLTPHRSVDDVNIGLVKLADPARAVEIVRLMDAALPDDVQVVTRADVLSGELARWVGETSIGLIFKLGVVVALVVGMAIVTQILSQDISSHLPEYATLKAMGYSNAYLRALVIKESLMLAVLGFGPALLLSQLLYRLTSDWANLPIVMTYKTGSLVFFLTAAMCLAAGLAVIRRLSSADPASLF